MFTVSFGRQPSFESFGDLNDWEYRTDFKRKRKGTVPYYYLHRKTKATKYGKAAQALYNAIQASQSKTAVTPANGTPQKQDPDLITIPKKSLNRVLSKVGDGMDGSDVAYMVQKEAESYAKKQAKKAKQTVEEVKDFKTLHEALMDADFMATPLYSTAQAVLNTVGNEGDGKSQGSYWYLTRLGGTIKDSFDDAQREFGTGPAYAVTAVYTSLLAASGLPSRIPYFKSVIPKELYAGMVLASGAVAYYASFGAARALKSISNGISSMFSRFGKAAKPEKEPKKRVSKHAEDQSPFAGLTPEMIVAGVKKMARRVEAVGGPKLNLDAGKILAMFNLTFARDQAEQRKKIAEAIGSESMSGDSVSEFYEPWIKERPKRKTKKGYVAFNPETKKYAYGKKADEVLGPKKEPKRKAAKPKVESKGVAPKVEPDKMPEPVPENRKPNSWINNLKDQDREAVFDAMRGIESKVQFHRDQERKLRPQHGTIGLGSADFDHTIQAEAIESYLRGLRTGLTPDGALEKAKADAREMVQNWNTKGVKGRVSTWSKEEIKRWEGTADATLEDVHRRILNAGKKWQDDVLVQIRGLSSGTLATMSGKNKYEDIDKIHADFIDYAQKNKHDSVASAWEGFQNKQQDDGSKPVENFYADAVKDNIEMLKEFQNSRADVGALHYNAILRSVADVMKRNGKLVTSGDLAGRWHYPLASYGPKDSWGDVLGAMEKVGKQSLEDNAGPYEAHARNLNAHLPSISAMDVGELERNYRLIEKQAETVKQFARVLELRAGDLEAVGSTDKNTIEQLREKAVSLSKRADLQVYNAESEYRRGVEREKQEEEARENAGRFDSSKVNEKPKKMTSKSLISLLEKSSTRFNFVKEAQDTGWGTDGKFAVKMNDVDKALLTAYPAAEGRGPNVPGLVSTLKTGAKASLKGIRISPTEGNPNKKNASQEALIEGSDGRQAVIDAKYVDIIRSRYPDAEIYLPGGSRNDGPVMFKKGSEVVGIVMPKNFKDPIAKPGTYKSFQEQTMFTPRTVIKFNDMIGGRRGIVLKDRRGRRYMLDRVTGRRVKIPKDVPVAQPVQQTRGEKVREKIAKAKKMTVNLGKKAFAKGKVLAEKAQAKYEQAQSVYQRLVPKPIQKALKVVSKLMSAPKRVTQNAAVAIVKEWDAKPEVKAKVISAIQWGDFGASAASWAGIPGLDGLVPAPASCAFLLSSVVHSPLALVKATAKGAIRLVKRSHAKIRKLLIEDGSSVAQHRTFSEQTDLAKALVERAEKLGDRFDSWLASYAAALDHDVGVDRAIELADRAEGYESFSEWDESKHPRDKNGKFKKKGGGSVGKDDDYRGLHRAPGPADNSSLHNLQDTYPDDIYGPHGHRYYGHGDDAMDRYTIDVIRRARNQPEMMVSIFRAVPKSVQGKSKAINPGDWVTINRSYAILHGEGPLGGDYKILEKKVPAKHLFTNGDSIHEWGYHPSE